tara:strand:+ start:1262 stop:1402 length:141 start_codon:yes stop_codon:yes gene_type:complete
MADNLIFALVALFIAIAVMIGVSTQILGSVVTDCESLFSFNQQKSS